MPSAAPTREERNVPPMFCRRQPILSLLTIAAACCLLLAADKPDLADGDGGGVPGGFEGGGRGKSDIQSTKYETKPRSEVGNPRQAIRLGLGRRGEGRNPRETGVIAS